MLGSFKPQPCPSAGRNLGRVGETRTPKATVSKTAECANSSKRHDPVNGAATENQTPESTVPRWRFITSLLQRGARWRNQTPASAIQRVRPVTRRTGQILTPEACDCRGRSGVYFFLFLSSSRREEEERKRSGAGAVNRTPAPLVRTRWSTTNLRQHSHGRPIR